MGTCAIIDKFLKKRLKFLKQWQHPSFEKEYKPHFIILLSKYYCILHAVLRYELLYVWLLMIREQIYTMNEWTSIDYQIGREPRSFKQSDKEFTAREAL